LFGRTADKAKERPRNRRGPSAIYARVYKSSQGQRAPGRCAHHQKINVSNRGPFPPELVLSTARAGPVEDSELRRISCFPSHSGHRAVVHRSRSETCRARLTPRPFVPKQHGRNRRANWPRPKVAGASFLQQGYGNDSTHYPHPCRRHHDRAVTGLWLASLHDGKRGTSQISQSASLYAWQRTLLE
jgi:hypothetical protein